MSASSVLHRGLRNSPMGIATVATSAFLNHRVMTPFWRPLNSHDHSDSPPPTPPVFSLPPIHDAAQQARNLRHVLQDDKQRIGCFLGAGCPLGIYDEAGTSSLVLIPAVVELTQRVASGLHARDTAPGSTSQFKKQWDALCTECTPADGPPPYSRGRADRTPDFDE